MPATVTPKSVSYATERLGRIGDWMAGYVDAGKLPFAMTLIARHGEIAYFDIVGKADVEAATPITEDTIIRAYSTRSSTKITSRCSQKILAGF